MDRVAKQTSFQKEECGCSKKSDKTFFSTDHLFMRQAAEAGLRGREHFFRSAPETL